MKYISKYFFILISALLIILLVSVYYQCNKEGKNFRSTRYNEFYEDYLVVFNDTFRDKVIPGVTMFQTNRDPVCSFQIDGKKSVMIMYRMKASIDVSLKEAVSIKKIKTEPFLSTFTTYQQGNEARFLYYYSLAPEKIIVNKIFVETGAETELAVQSVSESCIHYLLRNIQKSIALKYANNGKNDFIIDYIDRNKMNKKSELLIFKNEKFIYFVFSLAASEAYNISQDFLLKVFNCSTLKGQF